MRRLLLTSLFALAVGGCKTTEDFSSAALVDNSPPVSVMAQRNYPAHPLLAGLVLNESAQSTPLQLFVSPSCNFCMRLLFNTVREVESPNSPLEMYSVEAIMLPRREEDIPIIAGLMCVDPERRAQAVLSYYRNLYRLNEDRGIGVAVAKAAYGETMDAFGITGPRREACEKDAASRALIAQTFTVVDRARTQNRVPVIFLDGEYVPVLTFAEMMRRI